MKVPSSRRQSTAESSSHHYTPYPPTGSPQFAHPGDPHRPSPSRSSSTNLPQVINDAQQPQYKVARAISSCTRCRTRKQKCDGKLPACSACERAKVECIGFDAISKTNVSRNYLHTLEQEVNSLRAQVAALTDRNHDFIGNTKRTIAANASAAIQSYRPDGLIIDPALVSGEHDSTPIRSPWDSPSGGSASAPHLGSSGRRTSEYGFPPTPSISETPRSPFMLHNRHNSAGLPGDHTASLGRMVHDAAFRTGPATLANAAQGTASSSIASHSEKGSVAENSPNAGNGVSLGESDQIDPNLEHIPTPRSTGNNGPSPLAAGSITSTGSNSGKNGGNGNGNSKRRNFAIPPLPPQPAVERLVAAYVDFVGVSAPIIHIPTLGKQLIRIREGRDVEESDVFVVMMVLALSTMASSRFVDPPDELRAVSEAFHAEAMKHLDSVFQDQSYVGLQAILLLVWYALLNPDKGSIWFLVGLASRTCVDLGYHNENNAQIDQIDALELDMRRRLFWITYKMDRLLCVALGRPPSIPDGYVNVPMPSPLHDVDIIAGHYGPLTGDACSYKAVFLHSIKCRQIQSEILNSTFGIYGTARGIPTAEWFEDMFNQIKDWLANAPEPRGTISAEGYAITFHNTALLLCRPSSGNPRPDRNALATVLASSSYIIRIYRRMQLNNRISWLWMTSHFTFMAGLSFLYAYFNLHNAAAPGVPTLDEAMMDIESCMAVLEYLAPRVPSASACHDTLQTVSHAILDQIQKSNSPKPTPLPDNRNLLRGAPISSSRDDPLPHNETFPAPLPHVPLPYELTLLDNLFRNPMAAHNKASDYTMGSKKDPRLTTAMEVNFNPASMGTGAPLGFPPGVFHTNYYQQAQNNQLVNGNQGIGGGGLGPYGIAAQVGAGITGNNNPQHNNTFNLINQAMNHQTGGNISHGHGQIQNQNQGQGQGQPGVTGQVQGHNSMEMIPNGGGVTNNPGMMGNNNGVMGSGGGGNGTAGGGGPGDDINAGFDVFSFLMDEEGLGGTGGWDALDVPPDFSLWS